MRDQRNDGEDAARLMMKVAKSGGQGIFRAKASEFNALPEAEQKNKLEQAQEERYYFGVIVEYKPNDDDVLVIGYDFQRLPPRA